MPRGRTCLRLRIQNCFWSLRNWAVLKKEGIKVDAEWKTSPSEATKTIRPCRQSVFSLVYFELGRRWQLRATGQSGKSGFLELLELYFCTPEQDSLLRMWRGRGETIFHGSIIRKPVFILHLTRTTHIPVLPATPCLCLLKLWCRSSLFTLSTFWLGWKLTPLPSINLMEITDYWLFCLRIEV